jgi:DNA polymerase-4
VIGCLVLPYFYTEAAAQRSSREARDRSHPEAGHRARLAERPVIIHARGRIMALSPEAEEAGLSQGMSLGQAYAICPHAEPLPYDEDLYQAAQRRVLDICAAYVSAVEPFCLHEIFLGLAGAGEPAKVMTEIANAVQTQAGFTCQAGAGSSKLVARIAALCSVGRAFPRPPSEDGLALTPVEGNPRTTGSPREGNGGDGNPRPTETIVPKGQEAQFLAPLPLSRLWLLDENTIGHLEALGITTIGSLQQTPTGHLIERFGSLGRRLSELAFGVDRCPVRSCYPPPVIAARLSLAGGVEDMTAIEAGLHRLAREVAGQLRSREQCCRRIGLEMETDDGGSNSQWLRASIAIISEGEVFRAAERLLGRVLALALGRAKLKASITALTLRAADLQRCAGAQLDLLGEREQLALRRVAEESRRERLTEVVGSVQQRFGARSVRWAREVEVPRRERMLACLAGGRR